MNTQSNKRTEGSQQEFDQEWQQALHEGGNRYLIYPEYASSHQFDFFEWTKAQQIVSLLESYSIKSGDILEYGCGAAGMSLYLAELGHRSHICDLSHYALQVAQENRSHHHLPQSFCSSTIADALNFPYAEASFDVVMSYGLLEHFERAPLTKLLSESVRILKPGGLFIADIVPSLARKNARTFGVVAGYGASLVTKLFSGRWRNLSQLHKLYFDHYYESTYDDQEWKLLLSESNLKDILVQVCRPFPPLPVSGKTEALYTSFLRKCLPIQNRFDGSNSWLSRRWGWMYLASGRKPEV